MKRRLKIIGIGLLSIVIGLVLILSGIQIGLVKNNNDIPKVVFTVGEAVNASGITPDYIGTDAATVQQALNALPGGGGEIDLISPTYTFAATVSRAINNVTFKGTNGCMVSWNGVNALFSVGAQTGWKFEDLRTDAGGITNFVNAYLANVTLGATYYGLKAVGSIQGTAITGTSVTDSGLTNGRVPYAGVGGLLQDSANLTFNGTTLDTNGNPPEAPTGRGATLTIAANDATATEIAQADVRCGLSGTLTNGTGTAAGSPVALTTGRNTINVTHAGSFTVNIVGSALAKGGTTGVTGSPVSLTTGTTIINATGIGTILIDEADEIQISSAITSIPSGGKIHLTSGTFTVSDVFYMASNITLEGSGWNTIIQPIYSHAPIIVASSCTNVIIKDLQIDGNISAPGGVVGAGNDLISYSSTTNSLVQNCYLHDSGGDGFDTDGGQNIIVTNCVFKDNSGCATHISQSQPNYITVSDCMSIGNGAALTRPGFDIYDGIEVISIPAATHVTFSNNISENDYIGIHLTGLYNKAIGNTIYNSTTYGIWISNDYNNSEFNEAIGNIINTTGTVGIKIDGLATAGVINSYNLISNNNITNTVSGIVVTQPFNTVSSNTVNTSSSVGISISANDTNVNGNEITNASGGSISASGLRDIISHNVINAGTYGISASGDKAVINENTITSTTNATFGGISITGDYAVANNNIIFSCAGAGVLLNTAHFAIISGNQIDTSSNIGISFTDSDYVNVDNNKVINNTGNGINIDTNSDFVSVTNNVVKSNTGTGIMSTGALHGTYIGNFVTASGGRGMDFVSTTYSVIKGNNTYSNTTRNIAFDSGCNNDDVEGNITIPAGGAGDLYSLVSSIVVGNVGFIATGEIRTISGTISTLTQDAFNSVDNPFGQTVRVLSLNINVSTGATATTPNIDCGIGNSATTDYVTLFDDLPGETVGYYTSTIAVPGTQTVPQTWASGGGNRYLNMSIKDAAATGMIATYTITIMGN